MSVQRRRPKGSAGAHVRTLVIVLVALIPLGTLTSLFMIQQQSQTVRSLTLALGPAVEANNVVLLEMTRARATWLESQSGDDAGTAVGALQLHRSTTEQQLEELAAANSRP